MTGNRRGVVHMGSTRGCRPVQHSHHRRRRVAGRHAGRRAGGGARDRASLPRHWLFYVAGHGIPGRCWPTCSGSPPPSSPRHRSIQDPCVIPARPATAAMSRSAGDVGTGHAGLISKSATTSASTSPTTIPSCWPASRSAIAIRGLTCRASADHARLFRPVCTGWARRPPRFAIDLGSTGCSSRTSSTGRWRSYGCCTTRRRRRCRQARRARASTDYGNLTLLAVDEVKGLAVRTRSGEWIEAPTCPGALICNIGDCLMRWTNDTYVSTPHRVVSPRSRDRYSVVFFLDPNPDAVVACIPELPARRRGALSADRRRRLPAVALVPTRERTENAPCGSRLLALQHADRVGHRHASIMSARPTMAPMMPYSSAGRSSRKSSSELTPPEAMTGVVRCWASVIVASTLTPPMAPSRSMSV